MNLTKARNGIIAFFVALFVLLWLTPFVYVLFTALKSPVEYFSTNPLAFPKVIAWENFHKAYMVLDSYFVNNVKLVVICLPLILLFASMAAYSLARLAFRGREFWAIFFLVGMMVPISITIVPIYIMFKSLGLINTHTALVLALVAFGLPFTIFLMRGFFLGIPKEIEESARIDGCRHWGIYARIIIPISRPILITAAIFNFMGVWNDFFFSYTFIQDNDKLTLNVGLLAFTKQFVTEYNSLTAGMILIILPSFVLFVIFQRYIMARTNDGAVKG
ncbi:carbohydrate ABC transporter permease [Paenibacillus cellulositrophicus]|uniref:carbohydrate ABC transporter permease n=1 Tax=Paenibacillus cellulositrophicus TaxID=562959 RepID=UPI003F8212FE